MEYKLFEKRIVETECIRDLGILIDRNLSFSDHIKKIVKQGYLCSYQLLKILKTRDLNTLVLAYKTYIRPLLEYGTEIWNPKTKQNIIKLEKIQKFFTRKAFYKCGLAKRPYEERLRVCGLKRLNIRRDIGDLAMVHKMICNKVDISLQKYFIQTRRACRKPLLFQNRRFTNT